VRLLTRPAIWVLLVLTVVGAAGAYQVRHEYTIDVGEQGDRLLVRNFHDPRTEQGTGRTFRGRGLAKLAKNDSLHRARAAGFTDAFTGNDAGNEPMLAINRWFGYEICATEVAHVRDLG